MKKHIFLFFAVISVFTSQSSNGQGCSDAGFCTMGAMRPDQKFHQKGSVNLRSVEISHYLGITTFDDEIYAYTVDLNFSIGSKMQGQIKLPYQRVSGPMGNTHGLGDFSLSLTRNLVSKEHLQINGTIGAKIPTGEPNKTDDKGRPLPMYYQTTLGTYDLVFGLSAKSRGWLFAVGYQMPLNSVDNKFLWSDWNPAKDENKDISNEFFVNQILQYPPASDLRRGYDVMMRVERNFRFSRFNFNLGLLPIYRLRKDRSRNGNGELIVRDGTDGLALTGLIGGGFRITTKSAIKAMVGFQLTDRDFNPDGLSRTFVNTVGYELRF